MDPSETGDSSNPLADITNTINQGSHVVLDPTERKRQRNKERYASLSREQKDELNRKARERRAEKKKRDQASLRDEGGDGQFNGGHITIEGGTTCGDDVSIHAEKESPHKPDGNGLRIEDNDNGAEDPITPELQGGKIKCSIMLFMVCWRSRRRRSLGQGRSRCRTGLGPRMPSRGMCPIVTAPPKGKSQLSRTKLLDLNCPEPRMWIAGMLLLVKTAWLVHHQLKHA